MDTGQCTVLCLDDQDLIAMIRCAKRRLVLVAPGVSESVAKAIVETWKDIGPARVQIVLDVDPEVCRMGYGQFSALQMLFGAAKEMKTSIHQQAGLRIGVIVTDESTVIYSPTPLLVEAGGKASAKPNAIRLEAPLAHLSENPTSRIDDLRYLNLEPQTIDVKQIQTIEKDLASNPPVKFDVAQKVRVFNARFEFVEFELRGLAISRKKVPIPSDLLGLAREPRAQKLLHSSFQLIEEGSELSGDKVTRLKQFIAQKYLINLPGYGSVILRSQKETFEAAVAALAKYIKRFQRQAKKKLQVAIDSNRRVLTEALLPSVEANPPIRWKKFLGTFADRDQISRLLDRELTDAFGSVDDLIAKMKLKVVFKGVTYESLSDPEFQRIAREAIPSFPELHMEYDAAKASNTEK